ncbi:bromodomain protein [Cryptosporidium felis]|nr:bromodomain protein [Cryptosporidium felis]
MGVDPKLTFEENGGAKVRGELMLTLEEAGQVQRYLIENSDRFGFELSPEPAFDSGKKGSKKKFVCSGGLAGRGHEHFGVEARSEGRELPERVGAEGGGSEDPQRKLPDWAKRFHRILKIISQQELFSPFVSTVNVRNFDLYIQGASLEQKEEEPKASEDPDHGVQTSVLGSLAKQKEIDRLFENAERYIEYLESCSPLKPLSLNSIITKLENNEYSSAAHVFCDIYSVWICAFRSVRPGEPLWIKAVDASLNFSLKLLNEPLQDDFSLTFPGGAPRASSRGGKSADHSALEPPRKLQNTGKSASPSFFEDSGKAKRSSLNQSSQNSAGSKSNQKSSRKSGSAAQPSHAPKAITESERHEFQSLLAQLSQNDHVELFNSFFSTAHWKEVNSGEVELDDQQTPPSVFREMIKWCKLKLNIPILEDHTSRKDASSYAKGVSKKSRQSKLAASSQLSQKKKSQLSAKQFFSSGRAFSSPSSSSGSEEEDEISSCGNLPISQQWASTSSSGESDSEPELTSFYPHFNSK